MNMTDNMNMTFVTPKRPWRLFASDTRGVSTTESALVTFPFLLLMFGALGLSQAVGTHNALQQGVESAARCGALYKVAQVGSCRSDDQIRANAVANATAISPAAAVFTPSQQACGEEVDASYPYVILGVIQTSFVVSAKACFPDGRTAVATKTSADYQLSAR